ncbi:MAG TPA: hypothetical protein EYO83_04930 [Gemmatimonadetes bacterium]|jgi:hypothetical protein|nr:hypothetical protein [Gemmatimonadota bacterium]
MSVESLSGRFGRQETTDKTGLDIFTVGKTLPGKACLALPSPFPSVMTVSQAGGHQGGDGDGGEATNAGLERPHGCGIDRQGNLYIADGINHRVRVVGMR